MGLVDWETKKEDTQRKFRHIGGMKVVSKQAMERKGKIKKGIFSLCLVFSVGV